MARKSDLTDRRAQILRFIVEEYVSTAAPVGSQHIVRKHRLHVSPATIRNEMARLEDEGYISHPHTSAGRVPSDKGYRYYVEALMREQALPLTEQETIRHQFHQAGADVSQLLRLAAAVLAQAVQNAALVTPPRAPACRLRHVELVSLHDFVALLVVVLQDGRVLKRTLSLEHAVSQQVLTAVAHRLTELFAGKDAAAIETAVEALPDFESFVAKPATEMMRQDDQGENDEAALEGLRHVLSQPEFATGDRMLAMIDMLEERALPRILPLRRFSGEGVHVLIGAENRANAMRECSVIVAGYGVPGEMNGAVAVVGPTRMRYSRTISTVRYLSSLMSELVEASF